MTSRVVFQAEMDKLNEEIQQMAVLAKEAIEKAVNCIVNKDPSFRKEVEKLDSQIYELEMVIEKRCLDVIALHTPVAGDLRTVSTCLRIITDLDRIGRYASDIVELYDISPNGFPKPVNISHMAQLVLRMVTDAIDDFINRDAEAAAALYERDDEIDCLYDLNFRAVLTYMIEDPKRITAGTHIILVARYLERIADHACNIGERVVYMVTGERMNPKERQKADRTCYFEPKPPQDPEEERFSTHELEDK